MRPEKLRYVAPSVPPRLRSYYERRRDYFSRFDQGVAMDREMLFSVCPERVAQAEAKMLARLEKSYQSSVS